MNRNQFGQALLENYEIAFDKLTVFGIAVEAGSTDPECIKVKTLFDKWLNFFDSFGRYENAVTQNKEKIIQMNINYDNLYKEAIHIRGLTLLGVIGLANDDLKDEGVDVEMQRRRMCEYLTRLINFRKKLNDLGLINN